MHILSVARSAFLHQKSSPVTCASGTIGREVARALAANHEVVTANRSAGEHPAVYTHLDECGAMTNRADFRIMEVMKHQVFL